MTDLVKLIDKLENGLVALNNKRQQQLGALSLAKQLLAEQQEEAAQAKQLLAEQKAAQAKQEEAQAELPVLAGEWSSDETEPDPEFNPE